ncbi:hypothetical protein [Persephonella sp.]
MENEKLVDFWGENNKETAKKVGSEIGFKTDDTEKPILIVKSKLPYYLVLLDLILGSIGFIYISYDMLLNNNYTYYLFYGFILFIFFRGIKNLKKFKNEEYLPTIMLYKSNVEIICDIEFGFFYSSLVGINFKKVYPLKEVSIYKTFSAMDCSLVGLGDRILINKEIAPDKVYPGWWGDFLYKIRHGIYIFVYIPIRLIFIIIPLNILLFIVYRNNYSLIFMQFKNPEIVSLEQKEKSKSFPVKIYGFFFLITEKSDYESIERLMKTNGGRIKWKPLIVKL